MSKRVKELYYIFFLSCSLYAESFIRKKNIFLIGITLWWGKVFLSACACRCTCRCLRDAWMIVWALGCVGTRLHTQCLGVRANDACFLSFLIPPTPWTTLEPALSPSFTTETKGSERGRQLLWLTGHQRFCKHFRWNLWFLYRVFCFKLDCHSCSWRSITAQPVSLYCTVPWNIPLQLKHRGTFLRFFRHFSWWFFFFLFFFCCTIFL